MSMRVIMLLDWISATTELDRLATLHHPLELDIKRSEELIESVSKRGGNQWDVDAVVDSECDRIEEILGIAFVTAQTFLTAVRTRIVKLAESFEQDYRRKLSVMKDEKGYTTLKRGGDLFPNSGFTRMEAINAVANYWKHHDEWPTELVQRDKYLVNVWKTDEKKTNEARTAKIVTSLGMGPSSSGNLRTAARSLSIDPYYDLQPLRSSLAAWAVELQDACRKEIDPLLVENEAE